jgi:hypothetical protein
MTHKCNKCAGTNLKRGKLLVRSAMGGDVEFMPDKAKMLTLQNISANITATMCLDCGLVELIGDTKQAKAIRTK